MTADLRQISQKPRPVSLAAIAVSGVLASGFLGGTTNAVNGAVSPTYFVTILRWQGVEDVWRASIAQGIFEGLLFGIFFSLLFTVATGIVTGASCSFGFASNTCWASSVEPTFAGRWVAWRPSGWQHSVRSFTGERSSASQRSLGQCSAMHGLAARFGVPNSVGWSRLWSV